MQSNHSKVKNIFQLEQCYGCGVCAISCPQQMVSMELDKYGFYQPRKIKGKSCTACGICINVCAYCNNDVSLPKIDKIMSFAAWSNSEDIRYRCSSGGIAFELGRYLLQQGYKACGVKYNVEQCRAEHFITENEHDFQASIGSKYLQSYTYDAFKMFSKGEKYFVTGTPCQIDSLRRYAKLKKMEDNFVLMDFFCHGIPTMHLWKKYLKEKKTKIGNPTNISWRNKRFGWHDSWAIHAESEPEKTEYFSLWSKGDAFYKIFLNDTCLGDTCYKCKFKSTNSAADLRVGDLWGRKYKNNNFGVSGVLVYSESGNTIVRNLQCCTFIPEKIEIVTEGQIKIPSIKPCYYHKLLVLIENIPLSIIIIGTRIAKKISNSAICKKFSTGKCKKNDQNIFFNN